VTEIVAEWWDESEGRDVSTGYWSVDINVDGMVEKTIHRSPHLYGDHDECEEWAREKAEEVAEAFDESVEDGTLELTVEHLGGDG
jgi:uncharacterized protein YabN with tetrapyrrole methylase and pyrophosphatase domain